MEQLCPNHDGRQFRAGFTVLERHRHSGAYVAIVLSGEYEEAGDGGRFRVRAGQGIVHSPLEAHMNRYGPRGAEVLVVGIEGGANVRSSVVNIHDPDAIVRALERGPREASALLTVNMQPASEIVIDWPDELASEIRANPKMELATWADANGLAPETISRGFRKVYGITPSSYRAQVKARCAWKLATRASGTLACIALDAGFYDQAHMTRAVGAITGKTPAVWRSSLANQKTS